MSHRIKVGVLGATGMVGQNYVRLLENHPWFELTYVAASPQSANKMYREAVAGRWQMTTPIPNGIGELVVCDANDPAAAKGRCSLVFSAVELDKKQVAELEIAYAREDFAVVSNNSAHRFTADVPMIIPEINHGHLEAVRRQRSSRRWKKGCIVVKSNCSIQSYMTPLWALMQAGFHPSRIILSTLQAVSGAGYPGVPSLDMVDNIMPFIKGEEEKSEQEPLKIFGRFENGEFVNDGSIRIAAHCNRVPVVHGHTACVSVEFNGPKPGLESIVSLWNGFRSLPQELNLPSAPARPIIYCDEPNRPQPQKDRDSDKAMAVTVGRLRPCPVFDVRFVGLHHNTVRGASGGAILTAELMKALGYLE